MKARLLLRLVLAVCFTVLLAGCHRAEPGADVRQVFAEAREGKPLRCVFLGGSITQSGDGWVEPWLRQQFPKSTVEVVNSGMSATGSSLGIFRLEKDVIAYQPDLVAIEFCVNDGGLSDEDAVRYMETIVVRLKQLPRPPAIVILEAAARDGVNLERHRRIARHYGLVEVDFQKAVDEKLKSTGQPWETFFGDRVHPNAVGNAFYAEVIARTLAPFAESRALPERELARPALPPRLSRKPLLMDARMIPLANLTNAWKRDTAFGKWWDRFFLGALSAQEPGTQVTIPVRGSTIGVLFAMDKSYGTCFASLDEGLPAVLATNTRGGYSSKLLGRDVEPGEHRVSLVLPAKVAEPLDLPLNGPVKLGYLLVAGEKTPGNAGIPPVGRYTPDYLSGLQFHSIPPPKWQWAGPFGDDQTNVKPGDGDRLLDNPFAPETAGASVEWKPVVQEQGSIIDFRKLTGMGFPTMVYAATEISSDAERDVTLMLTCDYFARIWLNGAVISNLDRTKASAGYILVPAHLKAGSNRLLVKVVPGSAGFKLSAGYWQ